MKKQTNKTLNERISVLSNEYNLVLKFGNRVAKFNFDDCMDDYCSSIKLKKCRITKEYDIAKILFQNGISIPEPYEVTRIKIPSDIHFLDKGILFEHSSYPAFVMQYIEGVQPSAIRMCEREFEKAYTLLQNEREKVRNLGLFERFDDFGTCDTLYNRSAGKIFLIDFSRWRLK